MIGDISMGGVSVVSRFPSICRNLQKGVIVDDALLMLPLVEPIPITFEVRWVKRFKESVQGFDGTPRTFRVYKFGLLFVNPSQRLNQEINRFIARLATAEAI